MFKAREFEIAKDCELILKQFMFLYSNKEFYNPFRKHVRLGEFNVKTEPDCIEEPNYLSCADAALDIAYEKIHVHPEYKEFSNYKYNDIAIIRLKHPVSFTHFVMPICLPNKSEPLTLAEGQMFSVSGWGRTDLCKYKPVIRIIISYLEAMIYSSMF